MKHKKGTPPPSDKAALCAAVLPLWGRLLATSQAQSETAVSEMLSAFSDMTPILNASAGADLGLLVERMYVGFQYQDRISQMLALLQADMQRMLLAMTEQPKGERLGSEAWLQRLESQYAMAEQRRDHQSLDGTEATLPPGEETTFF